MSVCVKLFLAAARVRSLIRSIRPANTREGRHISSVCFSLSRFIAHISSNFQFLTACYIIQVCRRVLLATYGSFFVALVLKLFNVVAHVFSQSQLTKSGRGEGVR